MPVQCEPRLVVSAATVSGADVVVVTEEGRNYEVWTKQTSVQSGSVSADYPPVVDSRGV